MSKEEKALQNLLGQSVEYKVQDEVYPLKAKDLIQNASMSKDMKVTIDASDIKKKITEINNAKSTLNKDFSFKTHSGSVISVKGQGYGWALDVEKETKQVQQAFEKGEKALSLLIFTEMVGRRKVSVIKQQRIMASETRMRKFQLQSNKFDLQRWKISCYNKCSNW